MEWTYTSNLITMKKFLVIYGAPKTTIDEWSQASEEEQKKGMEEWIEWMEKYKNAFIDAGNPAGKNVRITKSGATEHRNEICGYSIIQAANHDDAVEIFSNNPHFDAKDAYIELMEITEM